MNYRKNEDRLVSDTPIGAAYNHIYSVDDISNESVEVEEPLTLQEVKKYIRLEGFTDDDSPGDDDFDYDDDLIEDLITEGRVWVEKYTGLHLISKTLQVVLLNQAGGIELPGPVTGSVVVKNQDGETIDSDEYSLIGSQFKRLESTFDTKITLEYEAGYTRTNIPKGLKTAIRAYVAYAYTHRGEEIDDKALTESAARKARPYRRLSLWG
jgi:uncharacterized phiE125 gp8 family phage protein